MSDDQSNNQSNNQSTQQALHRTSPLLRTLLWCAVLIAAGVGAVLLIFSTEPVAEREGAVRQTAMLVDVAQGEFGTFRPQIVAMGTVMPAREVTLRPRVSGMVIAMHEAFEPGGEVGAGQVLVTLDRDDYETELLQRRGELDQAQASLELERGRQEQAQAEFRAFNEDLPPARRALVLREPQRRAAEAEVEAARAALRQAELNLARTEIVAPFHAQVVERAVNLGSQVDAGDTLGRLVGVDNYWVEVSVPLARLPWLSVPGDAEGSGSTAIIRNRNAWPMGTTRTGEVFRLVGELDPQTRMARLLITVPNPLGDPQNADESRRLIIGEYVEARIKGKPIADVVRLDRDHIRANDSVWIMADGKLEIRPVTIEFMDERHAYISAGLSANEQVVTSRLATVEDGVPLRTGAAGETSMPDDGGTGR